RYFLDQLPENQDLMSDLGFNGVEGTKGLYFMTIPGVSALGSVPYPIYNKLGNFHFSDSISFIRGRHGLKGGAEVRLVRESQEYFLHGQAFMGFTGLWTGISAAADFVSGRPTFALGLERPLSSPMHQTVAGAFAQDDYQITNHLVLNLGVRYELSTVLNSPTNKLTNFSYERGLFTPGTDTNTALYHGDHNDFAPRI